MPHRKRLSLPALALSIVLLLSGCGAPVAPNQGQSAALDWKVHDFSYTNQDGETVSLEDLQGDVWLASFIFTKCVTVCPPMTANMVKLQQQLQEEGLDVSIVSFSVDPEVDSPEVLREYGESFDADFSNWHFLTGYTMEDIQQFAQDSFKTLVEPEPDSDQVMHGTSFYLVNQSGHVVEKFNGVEPPNDEIIKTIKTLGD